MATYNWFGLTYSDVVNAFRGAVATDFGGQSVIEAEMDMAESEIVNKLSQKALQMMQTVEYMEVQQISGNSWSNTTLPIMQDLYVWEVSRYNPALNNTVESTLNLCETGNCPSVKKELSTGDLFTDYTLNNGVITFGSSFDQDRNTYYVSYTSNTSTLEIPSLAVILRNRVCCVLGHQLYSRGDDSWKLVDIYCSRGDSGLDMIDQYFIPSELKRNKYLNNPFRVAGGLVTVKTYRG